MALIACEECGKEISAEALTCPHCGKPSKKARNKAMDSKQGIGCILVMSGIVIALLFHPLLGGILFVAGLFVALFNTRYS